MLEDAAVLALAEGGLSPCAALRVPACMPLSRGFRRPMGCLEPTKKNSIIKKRTEVLGLYIHCILIKV